MNQQEIKETPNDVGRMRDNLGVIFRVGIGNILEWYDWTAYAIFASFVAKQFFNPNDPTASLLATLGIFAVGFFMRPLGGVVFGKIADRFGRRKSLTTSILFAAGGSLLIGVSPTYEQVGLFAAALLLLARLAQGLGHGGEVVASYAYIAEVAPPQRRGLWSSTIYISVTIGVLSASLLGALMTTVLGTSAVAEWAWRIPFLIGAAAGVYAVYMRRTLDETTTFKKMDATRPAGRDESSVAELFRHHKWTMARLFIIAGASGVFYYTWGVSAPSYAITVKGIDPAAALWASVVANLFFICILMPFGALSDRIGRKPMFLFWCIGTIIFAIPLGMLIDNEAWQLGLAMAAGLFIIAPLTAVMPAYYPELFPANLRGLGVGLAMSLGIACLAGTAPYVQTALASSGHSILYDVYMMVLAALAGWALLASPETKGKNLEA